MSAKILLTGGAGYLGSVMVPELLAAGHHVKVLDNLMYGQHTLFHLCAHPNFDFVFGDARDESTMRELVKEADVLLPLAAIVGAPACDRDPWLGESVNLGAVQLINRLRSPNQLVVYPTTNSGYGTTTGEMHCTEETPLEPISLYGRTKVQAEEDSPNRLLLHTDREADRPRWGKPSPRGCTSRCPVSSCRSTTWS